MVGKIDEVDLDLNEKGILEGWQEYYCPYNVKLLRLGRNLGASLPPVNVVKKGEIYQIVYGRNKKDPFDDNYGGHNRARLSIEDGLPLKCSVFESHRLNPSVLLKEPYSKDPSKAFFPVHEMYPKVDIGILRRQLARNLLFIPGEYSQEFLEREGLILSDDGRILVSGAA